VNSIFHGSSTDRDGSGDVLVFEIRSFEKGEKEVRRDCVVELRNQDRVEELEKFGRARCRIRTVER